MTDDELIKRAMEILEGRLTKPSWYIRHPEDVRDYLRLRMSELEYESFTMMFLDRAYGVIATKEVCKGTIDSSVVYPREVVKAALHFNAQSVLIAHNHPTGIVTPSTSDIKITHRLWLALRQVDIDILDHIIVGKDTCFSFEDNFIALSPT